MVFLAELPIEVRHLDALFAKAATELKSKHRFARAAVPELTAGIYGAKIWNTPAPRVFHALVAFRPALVSQLKQSLGRMLGELP